MRHLVHKKIEVCFRDEIKAGEQQINKLLIVRTRYLMARSIPFPSTHIITAVKLMILCFPESKFCGNQMFVHYFG